MMDILYDMKKIHPASWLKSCLFALVVFFAYYSAIKYLLLRDWMREDYSHCALIPFVVLYLLWEKRKTLASIPSVPSWLGLVPFGLGIGLFWLGELGGEFFTLYISLWLVIVGLSWMHLGWAKIREIWFALVMILAMFPLPNFINVSLSLYLKLISSQLGVWMLHLYGMSAYREGNIIDLGLTQLQVVDACSGLRYVIPLLVLSLLMAYWFKAALWKRFVLVLSSIPLAVVVNSLRIAITGILCNTWGARVAEDFFHGFSGWLIFMLTIPVLLLEMWILNKVPDSGIAVHGSQEEVKGEKITAIQDRNDTGVLHKSGFSSFFQPKFVVAVIIMVLMLGISHGVEFREKIPASRPFVQFPLKIGEWQGTPQLMEKQFIDTLHFSDYIMMNYQNPQGKDVDFYAAYYESQRKGASTHSPETCLPGSGWSFKQSGTAHINPGRGRTMEVNRAFMEKSGSRQLIYFWFPQRNRILTSLVQVKIYSFWDALTRQRTDGALVRIITPVYPHEDVADAEARLQAFTRLIAPVIGEFIPQ